MRFLVEDQYPTHWISGNESEAPLNGCERVPWKTEHGMEGADWSLDIKSLEELIMLGEEKECNLFIDIKGKRIVFTKNIELD